MWGPDHLGDGRPHVLVDLYGQWLDRQAKVTKLALDAGIDERRVKMAEGTANEIVETMQDAMTGLIAVLRIELRTEAPGVAWPAVEAVLLRQVGPVMATALRKRSHPIPITEADHGN